MNKKTDDLIETSEKLSEEYEKFFRDFIEKNDLINNYLFISIIFSYAINCNDYRRFKEFIDPNGSFKDYFKELYENKETEKMMHDINSEITHILICQNNLIMLIINLYNILNEEQ